MIRTLRLLLCCVAIAGCSRGPASVLPSRLSSGTAAEASRNGAAFKIVYTFAKTRDGEDPTATLLNLNGSLYGTAARGGQGCCGVVYKLNGSAESVLHSFDGSPDGASPYAGLIAVNGALYGTTASGGTRGNGVVFKIDSSGKESVVYRFQGAPDGMGPYYPVINVGNTLYGTTLNGGTGLAAAEAAARSTRSLRPARKAYSIIFKGAPTVTAPMAP